MRLAPILFLIASTSAAIFAAGAPEPVPYRSGSHKQLVRQFYSSKDGLPADSVSAVAVSKTGVVRAVAQGKVARKEGVRWVAETGPVGVTALFTPPAGAECLAAAPDGIWALEGGKWAASRPSPHNVIAFTAGPDGVVWALAPDGLSKMGAQWQLAHKVDSDFQEPRSICSLGGERIYVAAKNGLFGLMGKRTYWLGLEVGPTALPTADVRSVSLLGHDHIVAATAQGAAVSNGLHWKHVKGADGLPIEDITLSAVGPDGAVWFGSERGVVRWKNG